MKPSRDTLLALGHALTHWYPATFYLLLPIIGNELGLSFSQIGLVMTCQYIAENQGGPSLIEMPTDEEARRGHRVRVSLLAGGGGLLLAAGGATVAALSGQGEIKDEFFGDDARVDPSGTAGWDSFEADLSAARRHERVRILDMRIVAIH